MTMAAVMVLPLNINIRDALAVRFHKTVSLSLSRLRDFFRVRLTTHGSAKLSKEAKELRQQLAVCFVRLEP